MIEKWRAAFKRVHHAGYVNLVENVLGQVGAEIHLDQLLHVINRPLPEFFEIGECGSLSEPGRPQDFLLAGRKKAEQPQVALGFRKIENFVHGTIGKVDVPPPGIDQPLDIHAEKACGLPESKHSGLFPSVDTPQLAITLVTAEKFIPAISRQRHRHILPRVMGHQEGRNDRLVGKRLAHYADSLLQNLQVRRLRLEPPVFGPEPFGDLLRIDGFIKLLVGKSDRKSLHWVIADLRHRRNHDTRIDTAA